MTTHGSSFKTLVTGANGTVGAEVVRALLARGGHVRAAVRSPEKSPALAAMGAEVVRADFADPKSLAEAFSGIDRAFLLTPFVEEDLQHVQAAVATAKGAGTRFMVRMSAVGADEDAPLALARRHAACEQAVRSSGLDWAVLRPTFFQDNLLNFAGPAIKADSQWYGASGGGRTSYISSRDIGEVAATVLADPERHRGQTYTLTGPAAHTDEEVASLLSQTIGRTIQYVDVGPDDLAAGMRQSGLPEWMVEALVGLEGVKAAGYAEAVSPVVRELVGRSGEPLAAFLERNRDRLVD